MPTQVYSPEVTGTLNAFHAASLEKKPKTVRVDDQDVKIQPAHASPEDWRDHWIYFIMTDRFNNPRNPPKATWNQACDTWQGGTFEGIRQRLKYIKDLGAGAIWLSPIFQTSRVPGQKWTYHGYGAQHFLRVDGRFGSDGTSATAERELIALVEDAHAEGLYVILDIVLNHAGEVFEYDRNGTVVSDFKDPNLLYQPPLAQVPDIPRTTRCFPPSGWVIHC